jgi:phosphoribosylformylglycinamidine synthase
VAFDGPLFAEGPGAFVVSGAREALARFGGAARVIGEVGGDALVVEGVLDQPVAELTRVHRDGLAALVD